VVKVLKLKSHLLDLRKTMTLTLKETAQEMKAVEAVAVATAAKVAGTMQVLSAKPTPRRLTL
jgi:hypothetical protein